MVTSFGDRWQSVIEAIRDIAPSLGIDPSQVVAGSYTTMTINAPAVVVYLEPEDMLTDEAGYTYDGDRATCICFVLVEHSTDEQHTVSHGVDIAREILTQLSNAGDAFEYIEGGARPIKIDDVYATHAVVTLTFTIPL